MNAPASPERPSALPPALRGARASFVFLTRLPFGGFPYAREDFAWAPAYFPLVGAVVGGIGAAALLALAPLDPLLAAAFAVGVTAWVTGAFHEDGLADTFDGLGGGRDRAHALQILKDSRVGAFGATALFVSQLLRVAALAALTAEDVAHAALALCLAHTLARLGPVFMMRLLPYVTGPEAKGAATSEGHKGKNAAVASAVAAAACALLAWLGLSWATLAAASAATLAVTLHLARLYRRALGGIAGDLLGAQEQVTEVAVLVAALAVLRAGWA